MAIKMTREIMRSRLHHRHQAVTGVPLKTQRARPRCSSPTMSREFASRPVADDRAVIVVDGDGLQIVVAAVTGVQGKRL